MALTKENRQKVISRLQHHKNDGGSSEVQVGLLTERINGLEGHFKEHLKDHHSRRGLIQMVSKRRQLLDYLRDHHFDRYQKLITELGIRK